jgi:hypothetical protein
MVETSADGLFVHRAIATGPNPSVVSPVTSLAPKNATHVVGASHSNDYNMQPTVLDIEAPIRIEVSLAQWPQADHIEQENFGQEHFARLGKQFINKGSDVNRRVSQTEELIDASTHQCENEAQDPHLQGVN